MSAAVDRVLAALEARGCEPKRTGRGWSSKCPAHKDDRASLSVGAGDDGRALVRCFAGCDFAAITSALDLRPADLFNGATPSTRRLGAVKQTRTKSTGRAASAEPESTVEGNRPARRARRMVAEYDYRDESGALLFQHVRYDPKAFHYRRPDGNGDWAYKLGDVRRVLYRLPQLVTAEHGAVVYVVEGEKAADRLAGAGLLATCGPSGAGKWVKPGEDATLEGTHVVILVDNDDPGRKHGQDVAARLHGRAASVRVIELPGLPEAGDVFDWLDASHDAEDLDRLAAEAPEWQPGSPPAMEPYRNGAEARAAVSAMVETSRTFEDTGRRLYLMVAEWFDRGGPAKLATVLPDRPPPSGSRFVKPVSVERRSASYVAAALGISRAHLYRLRDDGRVRRLLTGKVSPTGDSAQKLPERTLRPLSRLLTAGPVEDVPKALADAGERFRKRVEAATANGKAPPKSVGHVDTAAAVDHLLGARDRPPRGANAAAIPGELARQIRKLWDKAASYPGAPRDLVIVLDRAQQLASRWAADGDV